MNLNLLKPFTLVNKKEKIVKRESIYTENKFMCNKCGDIIESTSVHDFKFCKCGTVAVDGGHDYLRRCGNYVD